MNLEHTKALAGALVGLEIQRAQISMLSVLVRTLCSLLPEENKDIARKLITEYAEREPKFVVGAEAVDQARYGITQVASHWISVLAE